MNINVIKPTVVSITVDLNEEETKAFMNLMNSVFYDDVCKWITEEDYDILNSVWSNVDDVVSEHYDSIEDYYTYIQEEE